MGLSELSCRGPEVHPPLKEWLERIYVGSQRLNDRVNQMIKLLMAGNFDRKLVRQLITIDGEALWWELNGDPVRPIHTERPPHKMVRVPLELYERLRRVARKQQRPVSWEIKIALENHAEKNGEPGPQEE